MAGVGEQDYIAQIGQWGPPFCVSGSFLESRGRGQDERRSNSHS